MKPLLFLLLLGCVDCTAYIKIADFIADEFNSVPGDPTLILTEDKTASGLSDHAVGAEYKFDMFNWKYYKMNKDWTPINATTYTLSLKKLVEGETSYVHPLTKRLVLRNNDRAILAINERGEDKTFVGTACNIGQLPEPVLDAAEVRICILPSGLRGEINNLKVTGRDHRCPDCKDTDFNAYVTQDSLAFTIPDTNAKWHISIDKKEGGNVCKYSYKFGDQGMYSTVIKLHENVTKGVYECTNFVTTEPMDFWQPIWLPILLIVILILVIVLLVCIDRKLPRLREEVLKKIGMYDSTEKVNETPTGTRLGSLDTFRGFSITVMIFVNYGGGAYWFLEHAAWDGLCLADFVFPWFMFIMGSSIVFSVQSQLRRNVKKIDIFKKLADRFIKLFAIGIFLNTAIPGGVVLRQWRVPGVLQRIGFTYFVCGCLELLFTPKLMPTAASYGGERLSVPTYDPQYERGQFLEKGDLGEMDKKMNNEEFGEASDQGVCTRKSLLLYTWPHWIVMAVITAVWCSLTYCLPVPGCPTGYLGPGGIADGGKYFNCTGGASGYIDRMIFGPTMYQNPTCKKMYQTVIAYDPEGLLGSIMAILTVYSGVLAGHVIKIYQNNRKMQLGSLIVLGFVSNILGIILCKGTLSGGWVPVNKNLWTLSFVLVTSGSSYWLLAIFYFIVDYLKLWCGAPFNWAGNNPIFLYAFSYILNDYFPFNWATKSTHADLMTQSIIGTAMWLFVAWILFRKKKFYKI